MLGIEGVSTGFIKMPHLLNVTKGFLYGIWDRGTLSVLIVV